LVFDECHLFNSSASRKYIQHYRDSLKLGVTASPWPETGVGHIGNRVIRPITFEQLVKQGYLVRPKYYAPSVPDLRGVKTANGDYVQSDLDKAVNKNNLVGDIVSHYKSLANGKRVICFAVSINHSRNLVDAFRASGIGASHLDANSSLAERQESIQRFERCEEHVLVNVGVLGIGVDIPCVEGIILARPTKSLNLHIQQIGRGTRPYPGKDHFVVLDHADNLNQHGFIEEERDAILDTTDSIPRVRSTTTCKLCLAVFYGTVCPSCNNSNPAKMRRVEVREGNLVELTPELIRKNVKKDLEKIRKTKGYKRGWKYYEAKRLYGEETAVQLYPQRKVPDWVKRKKAM